MYQLLRNQPLLLLFIVLANLALSAWCLRLDSVINNDGVTYLNLAQSMLDGKWAAFKPYSWPYYAEFIAGMAKISFLGVENAAFVLNGLLVASLSIAFVCIVSELSNHNRRILLIAVLVILLLPSITKYRSFIIRDFAYLSCYLWSVYFIFRFCNTLNKRYLIGWLLFAALSCLFRIEGFAFLLIAPYCLLVFTATKIPHRRLILTILSALLLIISLSLAWWYINEKYATLIELARSSGKDVHSVFDLFVLNSQEKLGAQAFSFWGYIGVIFADLGIVLYEIVRRMAVLYFFFAVYAYFKNIGLKNDLLKRIWLVYLALNLGLLVAYSLYNSAFVSRYVMATALTLLIFAPLVIDRMLAKFKHYNLPKQGGVVLAILLLAAASLEGLDVRTKRDHIKKSGLWIKAQLPKDAPICSNNPVIIYYAGRRLNRRSSGICTSVRLSSLPANNRLNKFNYIALSFSPNNVNDHLARKTLLENYGAPKKVINGVNARQVFIFQNPQ